MAAVRAADSGAAVAAAKTREMRWVCTQCKGVYYAPINGVCPGCKGPMQERAVTYDESGVARVAAD